MNTETADHIAMIAEVLRDAGFSVTVGMYRVYPWLNRDVSESELATVLDEELGPGLTKMRRTKSGRVYFVAVD